MIYIYISYRHKPMFMIIQTVWNYTQMWLVPNWFALQSGSCWLLGDHKEIAHGVRRVARPSNGPSSNTRIIHLPVESCLKYHFTARFCKLLWQNFAIW